MKDIFNNYAPTPFYFYNDEFDEKEILIQLDTMAEKGIKAFFLHVRDGITQEAFGTDRFFRNVRFIIENAIKRNITPWLFDEDSYPSGQVGGKLAIDRPELLSYGIFVDKIIANSSFVTKVLGNVKGLYAYIVRNNDGKEEVEVLEDCFGPVRRRWYKKDMTKTYYSDLKDMTFNHVRGCTCYTEIMFEAMVNEGDEIYICYLKPTMTDMRYGTLVSLMNKASTDEIIKRVYEKYKKYVGEYFGTYIPGIFIDEPSLGGLLPYTEELSEYFYNTFGYSFDDNLYKLSAEYTGDSAQFRKDYVRAIKDLFTNNFIKPISLWCKENNLKLVGHFLSEEDPLAQAISGQDIYRNAAFLDVPGFDIITTIIGDYEHPSLILGANLIASSACQNGKDTVLAEAFALSPNNFGYDGLKRTADFLFSCGINWIVPHGFYYGYCAFHRSDAGKSFFFQDPLFDEYLKFSKYAQRVSKLLHQYQRNNDYLLVIPDGSLAEEVHFPINNKLGFPSNRAISILNNLYDMIRYFISNHIGFDLTQTSSLLKPKFNGKKVVIGQKEYQNVFIPLGGIEEEKIYSLLKDKCNVFLGNINDININGYTDFIEESKKDILVYKKSLDDNFMFFIFNNSAKDDNVIINISEDTYLYDATEDKYYALLVKNGKCQLHFGPYQSIILVSDKSLGISVFERYQEKEYIPDFSFINNQDLIYKPNGCKEVIFNHNLKIKDANGDEKIFKVYDARIRDVFGTTDEIYKSYYRIPYFDAAPRIKPLYPVFASFESLVMCSDEDSCDAILFDRDTLNGNYKIYWNDLLIDNVLPTRVYDKHNFYFVPKWKKGENCLKIVFEEAFEFDGIVGEIFIVDKNIIK